MMRLKENLRDMLMIQVININGGIMVDVLELNNFLNNSVNPFKWINDIIVFNKDDCEDYKIVGLSTNIDCDKGEESLIIEIEKIEQKHLYTMKTYIIIDDLYSSYIKKNRC